MKRYYTLAVRDDNVWSPEFGDYDRSTVQSELNDYRDHDYRKSNLKIVQSDDSQAAIEAAIAALNKA